MSGRFGKVRHAGPGLEEAVKAKASWGPSEAREPMRGSRSQSQEVQLIVSLMRDLAAIPSVATCVQEQPFECPDLNARS